MSFPYVRDIATIRLSPSLASHAPNVRIMIVIVGLGEVAFIITKGTKNIRLRVTPSKDSRVIKKCVWFIIRFIMVMRGNIYKIIRIDLFIELREIPIFGLQDQCLKY